MRIRTPERAGPDHAHNNPTAGLHEEGAGQQQDADAEVAAGLDMGQRSLLRAGRRQEEEGREQPATQSARHGGGPGVELRMGAREVATLPLNRPAMTDDTDADTTTDTDADTTTDTTTAWLRMDPRGFRCVPGSAGACGIAAARGSAAANAIAGARGIAVAHGFAAPHWLVAADEICAAHLIAAARRVFGADGVAAADAVAAVLGNIAARSIVAAHGGAAIVGCVPKGSSRGSL